MNIERHGYMDVEGALEPGLDGIIVPGFSDRRAVTVHFITHGPIGTRNDSAVLIEIQKITGCSRSVGTAWHHRRAGVHRKVAGRALAY